MAQDKGPSASFDICDARANPYEPCPKCGKDFGMGLVPRLSGGRNHLAVQCVMFCQHRGPETAMPAIGEEWPMSPTEYDRLAYEAWNTAAKEARP